MEESPAFYIDSNVLINAAANDTILGDKARNIISEIQNLDIITLTSCLTIDELFWILKRTKSEESNMDICKSFLESNIKFLDVNKIIIYHALDIILNYKLKPRDAIHVATMKVHNIHNLISEDFDFDKIKWIKRKNIMNFKI